MGRTPHSGPLARTVPDAAVMLDVMSGPAIGEPAIGGQPLACRRACELPLDSIRAAYSIAVPTGTVDDEVMAAFTDALDVFGSLGVELERGAPDFTGLSEPFTIVAEGAFAGLAFEMTAEQIEKIGAGARQLIDRGRRLGADAYYAAVQASRESASILALWKERDVLITPTVPWVPPRRDAFPATEDYDANGLSSGVWETFTSPDVTGQPAISLPAACSAPPACRSGSS